MPVIFNSISTFIESVGRRAVCEKPNSLDTLDTIFTGPSAYAQAFLPMPKSRHPEFPLMYCTRSEIVKKEALVAEVRVSYVGKIAGAPNGVYIGPPDISRSRHLGSVTYSTYAYYNENSSPGTDSSGNPIAVVTGIDFVSYVYQTRFTAKAVTFKYLTNQSPAGDFDGWFVSQAQQYLGTENLTTFKTGLSVSNSGEGVPTSTLVFENDLIDLAVEDLDNGWFIVSEVYMTEAYVNQTTLTNVVQ